MTKRTSILAITLASIAGSAASATDVAFWTIALSGDQAPGMPPGVVFDYFSDPRINTAGDLAFWADLAGPGITEDDNASIWSDRSGSLSLILRQGDPAPFALPIAFTAFPRFAFNDAADISFTAALQDTSMPVQPTFLGIFAEDAGGGQIFVVAREGFSAPGLPTGFAGLPISVFNAAGANAFNANKGQGIWSTRDGALDFIVLAGQDAPGSMLKFAFLDMPIQHSAGSLLFRASLLDAPPPPIKQPLGYGLWTDAAGPLAPIALTGDPAPGTAETFTDLAISPAFTDSGLIAFAAALSGDPEANRGLWTHQGGGATLLARTGDEAPGAGGAVFSRFSGQIAASESGAVAFLAFIDGPDITPDDNSGIWISGGGPPTLLVREGDQAPRLPVGVEFAAFSDPVLNEAGQIAFFARLRGEGGGGVEPENNYTLYASDRAGNLYPLLRIGDEFETGAGPRTIRQILFDHEPAQTGYSQFAGGGASGQLVLKLFFDDHSSGLFGAHISCLADMNADGLLNIDDFIAFQLAFALANIKEADFSGDGLLNIDDFIAFQLAFALGCD